jgi:hypothetical protein
MRDKKGMLYWVWIVIHDNDVMFTNEEMES